MTNKLCAALLLSWLFLPGCARSVSLSVSAPTVMPAVPARPVPPGHTPWHLTLRPDQLCPATGQLALERNVPAALQLFDWRAGKLLAGFALATPTYPGTLFDANLPYGNVSWSPEGRWVAFTQFPSTAPPDSLADTDEPSNCVVFDTQTGRGREIGAPEWDVLAVAFAPASPQLYLLADRYRDGRDLRFLRYDPSSGEITELGGKTLEGKDAAPNVDPILVPGATGLFYCYWPSPAPGEGGVWSVDTAGKLQRLVPQERLEGELGTTFSGNEPLLCAADGGGSVTDLYLEFWPVTAAKLTKIVRVSLNDGSVRRVLTCKGGAVGVKLAPHDNGEIAVSVGAQGTNSDPVFDKAGVYLTGRDLEKPRFVSPAGGGSLLWVDADHLLYFRKDFQLWKLNVRDGTSEIVPLPAT